MPQDYDSSMVHPSPGTTALRSVLGFDDAQLALNRAGRLAPGQRDRVLTMVPLLAILEVILIATVVAIAILPFNFESNLQRAELAAMFGAFAAVVGFLIARPYAEVRAGRIEMLEGRVEVEHS